MHVAVGVAGHCHGALEHVVLALCVWAPPVAWLKQGVAQNLLSELVMASVSPAAHVHLFFHTFTWPSAASQSRGKVVMVAGAPRLELLPVFR